MSEHMNSRDNRATIRWKLLTTASALVLTAYVSSAGAARAEDADRPLLQIELGGQLSHLESSQEKFTPPFFAGITAAGLNSPFGVEKPPQYSIDEYGKLTFRPDGSEWSFSAAIRYGRSTNKNQAQQHADPGLVYVTGFYTPVPPYFTTITYVPANVRFTNTQWASSEKHTILDFQVGKDVGVGLFGSRSTSEIGFGLRFAQFSSRSKANVNADPTIHYPTQPIGFKYFLKYDPDQNVYWEQEFNRRSFHGLGPTISWQGSTPIAGNSESAELGIDWDVNAAVLFGRQKARGYHQSSSNHSGVGGFGAPTYIGPRISHDRSRSVIVPNIGGSIGLSLKSGDAKVSFGYRVDLFMNAMDTGIDVAKKSNMLFHGPYASISIGIGD